MVAKVFPPFDVFELFPVFIPVKVPLNVLLFRYKFPAVQLTLPLKTVPVLKVRVVLPVKLRSTAEFEF